jgi:tRNA G10  N-methylase Trm11
MTDAILEWRPYKYFPYEREFGRMEVEQLFRFKPIDDISGLRVPSAHLRREAAERLTYFARVVHPSGEVLVPQQTRLEATARVEASDRQATRYSAHGLHEYKGKFNPQVVRAIGNILGVGDDAWILDPFCGSGTTLLECLHLGWNVKGIDRNPLAIRIANAKLFALRRGQGALQRLVAAIATSLAEPSRTLSSDKSVSSSRLEVYLGCGWQRQLPSFDYLLAWFPLTVLAQVVAIFRAIDVSARTPADRAILEVVLSDQLRDASFQEPADLRIRRRKLPRQNYPLIDHFVEAVSVRAGRIERARSTLGEVRGRQQAILGDSSCLNLRKRWPALTFDAVITSPPYETALPYIDTQRLSLVLLGDIRASALQSADSSLIGSREISSGERSRLEASIRDGDSSLPLVVQQLCRSLLRAASLTGNGFRRVNRPALALRYFRQMASFFENIKHSLKPDAKLALVVGKNHTVLGGSEFEIDTPALLAKIAEHGGYSLLEERQMDTYQRYDIHSRNSINTETLLVLKAPREPTKVGKARQ